MSTEPLLGEWACLGVLYDEPAHGWAVARELRPDGPVGRVWSLSRPLTYRSIDRLAERRWIEPRAEETGGGGPTRTIMAATRAGRARFRSWLRTPVLHLRDLRSELLLKLVFAERLDIDVTAMVQDQRIVVDELAEALAAGDDPDVVTLWRAESAAAAQRFLAQMGSDTFRRDRRNVSDPMTQGR
ncbi:MAG: PadR family transcriptional regulator [Ilumatobacter fluminis]|uniref:PadR family transcriptional regulator n=1 Tax=Ilumatobacter fluminis TaxID=467091 RepID=UPI0032EE42B1